MKRLHLSKVPEKLHSLVELAERFGVADDRGRELVRRSATPEELQHLRESVRRHDDELDAWLAGTESFGPAYSDEYIAFSAMRMTADGA
ncbi:hypothetical protein DBR47_09645 [Paucibacter sp. KBW04]|uniref:hypothetical protein n=1 Tax=Paucibacter sp. KBW04 TaxID=2153361 RepID=UPI000F56C9BC|nr:hypothetical protein [Paucibacter sp. KBW04]RQO60594.1 hypothetical protein DBR47_09645 [Paucibacter sp. KBW04]